MLADLDAIRADGFEGFETIEELRANKLREVPKLPGVYLLVRVDSSAPAFLTTSTGGHFKRKDPTVDVAALNSAWVTSSPVVYIGKASARTEKYTLFDRLQDLLRFGAGSACGHWGGRYVWQLSEAEALMVCWKTTPLDVEPRDVEKQMLRDFAAMHRRYPFANRQG